MRLSSVSFAGILLISCLAFAQHSSGGGGGGGGGSSSGGSHGGGGSSGGSSGYSGGGHSSGGSSIGHSSGGGGSHNYGGASVRSGIGRSGGSGSNSAITLHSGIRGTEASLVRPSREPVGALQLRTLPPEKRTFVSFLRHPFRKPEPKTIVVVRPPGCFKGPCRVCPIGQVHSGVGCVGARVPLRTGNVCSHRQIWAGGECLAQTPFIDHCSALRMQLERQAQRMQAAQSTQQNACVHGRSQACSNAAATYQSEEGFYRSLQERYRRCLGGSYALRTNPVPGTALSFDPLRVELDY